jgi:hypothetical protein
VEPARGRVGDGEQQRVVVEGFRDRERRCQERPHRGEHEEALDPLLRGDVVRQPGIAAPGPPEQGEHEHALAEALPGRVVRHEQGDLGQREDEDEVEEELERRDLLLRDIERRFGGFHRAAT